mmetsp:Transcript_16579/g.15866  ORF Transcript_16579/g.15866 Transcript_16579/m.15866 type:complete len:113 (+) Transcript_16579:1466-1804(+)
MQLFNNSSFDPMKLIQTNEPLEEEIVKLLCQKVVKLREAPYIQTVSTMKQFKEGVSKGSKEKLNTSLYDYSSYFHTTIRKSHQFPSSVDQSLNAQVSTYKTAGRATFQLKAP